MPHGRRRSSAKRNRSVKNQRPPRTVRKAAESQRFLMLVDVPNVRFRSTDGEKWLKLYDWADSLASSQRSMLAAKAFMNFPYGKPPDRGYLVTLDNLKAAGFEIIVNIKQSRQDDIDDAMVEELQAQCWQGDLRGVIIVSHDMRNFREAVRDMEQAKIQCHIVADPERLGRRYPFAKGRPHVVHDIRTLTK